MAIAWALEQTKYFTRGCKELLILTDHKPLVKLFGDRMLDEITNPRLFRFKERTLLWKFTIQHRAGKLNYAPDAMSRYPVASEVDCDKEADAVEINFTEMLAGIREPPTDVENSQYVCANSDVHAITWERVKQESARDPDMMHLMGYIHSVYPLNKKEMATSLEPFWAIRDQLFVVDGVVMRKDDVVLPHALRQGALQSESFHKARVIIPPSLQDEVLQSLHAAHQGTSAMNERAKAGVYWPGITKNIEHTRMSCTNCHRIAPSQSCLPPVEPIIPTTPFEAIVGDYFHFKGRYYLVIGDRLSG